MSDWLCRDCNVILTRDNTGGFQAGRTHVCKACERAHEQFVYEQFLEHEHYDDWVRATMMPGTSLIGEGKPE